MSSVEERIIYCDERFAIINKIPGEVCSSEEGKFDAEYYIPQVFRSALERKLDNKLSVVECVNRVDRPVSGIVLLALSDESERTLKNLFTAKEKVEKRYWAIIEGVSEIEDKPVLLKDFMFFNPAKQKSFICEENHRKSKSAELSYTIKGAGERYSYLEVRLITGRTHQIRAQLANRGMHIKGDVKYGARRSDTLPGIRLHSAHLEFVYPNDRKYVFDAAVPQTDALWNDANRYFVQQGDKHHSEGDRDE